ncbi:MGH1-like glycoside hydrolase domain-containing protein [Arcicella lustrica]|uniref:Glycosyl hydrolase family 65 protein n=1 Tax=Arcicella lustrica TaxID=2984196 RepID=A0ABU5SHF9_9BACT|nr:glycosyl hydrolase family 65 protein [Arcicella sp. DC25W]MEA5426709.1 glycosyl hydrolase family 65 protein [Arcicella sp. DC25W]
MKYKSNLITILLLFVISNTFAQKANILSTDKLKNFVTEFNASDDEAVENFVPNAQSFEWLSQNIPLFECPDSVIQKVYYYRWWALRKHLKQTPDGFIFTEFITKVNHAGKHNAVSSALGHHIYEGRWLRNQQYINEYTSFWLDVDPKHTVQRFHGFSSWIDDAVYNRYLVNLDKTFIEKNLLTLEADYRKWEVEKQLPNQLFYQFDVKDAMEESISGGRKDKNIRPTINSYMYGNAKALVEMAKLVQNDTLAQKYEAKATELRKLTIDNLWDEKASFFKVKLEKTNGFSDAREAIGFIPWYFNLPDDQANVAKAWNQLIDTTGFKAPWGITTAERRHPLFRTHGSGHGCEWDGPLWPYATTQTLKGLSNLLTNYKNHGAMNAQVFYDELYKYANSHQMNGKLYLGEYQDEKNGEWLKGDNPRSKFYNHSSFADLIINDLVGLKPRADNVLEIKPLIPEKQWDWFCLDNVFYHGKNLTILWDKTGKKYGKGKGFMAFVDGKQIAKAKKLKQLKGSL